MACNTDSMTTEEYQTYISEIINRLYREKSLYLVERSREDGKLVLAIEFSPPNWYSELSNDIQNIAFENLQEIMMTKIKNLPKDILN